MKITTYKGRTLGNSVSAFNFYKKNTGRGLQADVVVISRTNAFAHKLDKPETLTQEEVEVLNQVDLPSVLIGMYVAFRQAGDQAARRLSVSEIQDELEFADLQDPELLASITDLLSTNTKKA